MTKTKKSPMFLSRRALLSSLGVSAVGSSMIPFHRGALSSQGNLSDEPRFLIVIAGTGGASLIDSFLAIRRSEAGEKVADTLNCYEDAQVHSVENSPFRAVEGGGEVFNIPFASDQRDFIQNNKDDLMIVTQTATSVNHTLAQKRSLNGRDAWGGRTLQEAVASQYGFGYPLPNVNMGTRGYLAPGGDPQLPAWARGEPVANSTNWPFGLHGFKGIKGVPTPARIEKARQLRNRLLNTDSVFAQTFKNSSAMARWKEQSEALSFFESQDYITELIIREDDELTFPLTEYGLEEAKDAERIREVFPRYLTDPFEAQAALAFLLIRNRISVTVTIGPSFTPRLDFLPGGAIGVTNPPLAFDYCHSDHQSGQAMMWDRILSVGGRLASLLKDEPYPDGGSFWDRSMIYFATEFGRSKARPSGASSWGSAHDLNNGYALLSPLVNGNKVLGGVDFSTGLTYGFDPEDPAGVPVPGTIMSERQIYAGIAHALGIDTAGSGLPDMRAMRRNA